MNNIFIQKVNNSNKNKLFAAIAVLALLGIAISIALLFNPRTNETAIIESSTRVTISDEGVDPALIKIKKGTVVTWMNEGSIARSIILTTPDPPQELEGFGTDDPLAQNEMYSFTFEAEGTFTYTDSQNPQSLQGTIVVE